MNQKQKMGCALGILTVCISMPMWYWLLYQVLVRVNASETMWLVYYVYMPFGFLIMVVSKIVESVFDEPKK